MDRENYLTGITVYKGNSSEAVVLTEYVRAGFLVSLPFGNGASYDLVVDNGARLFKVQVKTGRMEAGCVAFNARRHRGSKYDTFSCYREGEIDVFAVWCPDNQQLYAVPAEPPLTVEGRLRIAGARNFQEKKIRWAKDYAWEQHVAKLRAERLATLPS